MTLRLNKYLLARSLALTICLILASGCSVTGAWKSAKDFLIPPGDRLDWDYLSFLVDESANNNSPLSVELVLVTEPELVPILAGLSAEQWFVQRKGLLQTSPTGLIVQGNELVPGKSLRIPRSSLPQERALAVFLFMNFLSTADHRLALNPKSSAVIVQIGSTDSTLQPIAR
jgi:type VI secretion system protein